MSSEATERKKGFLRGNWGKILLVLSLALNLVFIGAMAGAGWLRHKGGFRGPPERIVQRVLRHLPEDKQTLLSGVIKQHFERVRPKFAKVRTQRRALKQALEAEPFEAGNVLQVTGEIARLKRQLDDDKAALLVKVLEPLNAEERRRLLRSRFFRRLLGARRHGRRPPPEHR